MTACIHPPTSLQDATAMFECAGGEQWRVALGYGLGTVALVAAVLFLVFVALKAAAR